jgi:hypothetical protein
LLDKSFSLFAHFTVLKPQTKKDHFSPRRIMLNLGL